MKKGPSQKSKSKVVVSNNEPKPKMSRSEMLRLRAFKNVQDRKEEESNKRISENERVLDAVEHVDEETRLKKLKKYDKDVRRIELIQEALNMGWLPSHNIDFDNYEYSESVLAQMEKASTNYRVAVNNNRLDPRMNYPLFRLILLGFGTYFVYEGYMDIASGEWMKVAIDLLVLIFIGIFIHLFSQSIRLIEPDINLFDSYTMKN